MTYFEITILPVIVPHVIVHDFIEAVTDVITPEDVHGSLGIETYQKKIVFLIYQQISNIFLVICCYIYKKKTFIKKQQFVEIRTALLWYKISLKP